MDTDYGLLNPGLVRFGFDASRHTVFAETMRAFHMNEIIRLHSLEGLKEGIVYEDEYVVIECKEGKFFMTGKPFREPFIYAKVTA